MHDLYGPVKPVPTVNALCLIMVSFMSFMRGTDWDAPTCAACERQRCNTFENRASHATARRTIIMWQRGFKVLL